MVIAAGAKILGSFKVGDNSKIGAGAVVLNDVPPNCTVVGVPGRIVRERGRQGRMIDLDHANLPDPVERTFRTMERRIEAVGGAHPRARGRAAAADDPTRRNDS